ncbi:MAG: DUF4838 domain-containing protein [Victivallales bacterium]|nr:DUF4838 domain-containing protein [Victivallales bacterium]
MNKTFFVFLLCAVSLLAQTYKIVGPATPKPYEETALRDLTEYLKRRIQGDLTIDGRNGITFHVGDTDLAVEYGLASPTLPDEMWVIKSFGNEVVINGGGSRGALYATYHFLEDCCDIHWWSDYEEYVPSPSPLDLPALDLSGKPAFAYRNVYRDWDKALEITAIRNRLNANGAHVKCTIDVGGSVNYGRPEWTHTHQLYIPEEEFFAEHPDYFAMTNGKRKPGGAGQLCLSHPDLPEIFARKLCEFVEQDRVQAVKEGLPYPIYYDVSMNDNHHACTCPQCSEYAEKYGYSAQLVEFLNKVSQLVTPKYPDIYISSLAYIYNTEPPKKDVKAAKNIVIRLCDTISDRTLSILHPKNARFKSIVEEWGKHADNLSIWAYAVAYWHEASTFPFPSEFYYGDRHKFYRDNNVTGIFWEHEFEYRADMHEYKYFLECKLLEDPDADVLKLQDIFMSRYYGAAGPFVKEYRRIIDQACHENNGTVPFGTPVHYSVFDWLTDDAMHELDILMDRAEAAVADDELLLSRARRARLGIDLLALRRANGLSSYGFTANKSKTGINLEKAIGHLENDWREWVRRYPDATAYLSQIDTYLSEFKAKGPSLKVPEQFKDSRFYYFMPDKYVLAEGTPVKLVDDPESCSGKAVRVDGEKRKADYELPLEMGYFDRTTAKTEPVTFFEPMPEEPGYGWYCLGRVKFSKRCDLFFTRAWSVQVPFAYPEITDRTFEVWASIKFTGPMYRPGQPGDNCIYIGLVLLKEVAPDMAAEEIECEANGFSGHLQGIAADVTGIYWSFYDTIVKTDYQGRTLARIPVPRHSGDLCVHDGKVYVSVIYYDREMIKNEGSTGWVYVYDRDLKFLSKVALSDTPRPDGIAFLDGKFYIAGDDFGEAPHPLNTISVYDEGLRFERKITVDIGVPTQYGAQTLNAVDGKLLAGFYAQEGRNSILLAPSDLKPAGRFPHRVDVGLAMVPVELSGNRKLCLIVQYTGTRGSWGAKAIVYEFHNGMLLPASLGHRTP